MAQKGDILYNSANKETIVFIQTAKDSAGQLLQLEVSVAPGGTLSNSVRHQHPAQSETLFIKSGEILATIGAHKRRYKAGEVINIPRGIPHRLDNLSGQCELHYICEMRPALETENLYETAFALFQAQHTAINGDLALLQLALTLNKYKQHIYLARYPLWLQKILYRLLSPLAMLLGYKADKTYQRTSRSKIPRALLWS